MVKRMAIDNLFPTPVGWYYNEKGITEKQKKYLSELEQKPNEGNHTSAYRTVLKEKKLQGLNNWILNRVESFYEEVYKPKKDNEIYITQSWCNYSNKNQWHHKHAHPNSFISGIYYVNADESKDTVTFFNKDEYQRIDIPPRDFNLWNSRSWWFNIKSDMLVIFPSSLQHMVEQVNSDKTRISLSFNTFLKGYIGDDDSLTGLHI